jgi:TIR domain
MPEAGGGGIFVSYRRQETNHLAGRLSDRLADRFGQGQVFIDVDAIEPGVDFAEEISRAVAACQVLLAVIGPNWLTATDERGRRRLDDPDDIVRLEIEAALTRDVRVIPILVEGAPMPGRQDLPESLARLARRNALHIWHESFRSDADRLVTAIERVLAATSGTVDQSQPTAQAEVATVARDDRSGSNKPSETAGEDAADTAEVAELPSDEQPTRVEREIAILQRFDVPPEKGLNREEASLAFSDNGISPHACGSWTQHGWIIREGDRRWLSDKGRDWVRDQLAEGEDPDAQPSDP